MELEFNSQKELYNRVLPALKTKKSELRRKGIKNIKEVYIWDFLANEVFKNTTNLTLADVVSFIMHVDEERLYDYINKHF